MGNSKCDHGCRVVSGTDDRERYYEINGIKTILIPFGSTVQEPGALAAEIAWLKPRLKCHCRPDQVLKDLFPKEFQAALVKAMTE